MSDQTPVSSLVTIDNYQDAKSAADAMYAEIGSVVGLEKESEAVHLNTSTGTLVFEHIQDCCEYVRLVDFDLTGDLEGSRIVSIEITADETLKEKPDKYCDESFTWCFYNIKTTKGSLWMRWLGESNGYYSERVDMRWRPRND